MATSLGNNSTSDTSVKNKSESFHDNFWKKFKFLRTFKRSILSKIRSGKYYVDDTPQEEVTIISYDQRSFAEVEKELDLQAERSSRLNKKIFESLKYALQARLSKKERDNTDIELLQIVEKTFARQLDIFEEVLKVINSKNGDITESLEKTLNANIFNKAKNNAVENLINDFIKNLSNEVSRTSFSSESLVKITERVSQPEKSLGDGLEVKRTNISCECEYPNSGGAAVPEF